MKFWTKIMPCMRNKRSKDNAPHSETLTVSEKFASSSSEGSHPHKFPYTHFVRDSSPPAEVTANFTATYPGYASGFLDDLRKADYARLDDSKNPHVYLDYTGSGLYASTHIQAFFDTLSKNIYGNPHSTNPTSMLSTRTTHEAKEALLGFVDADSEVYDVVWTPNTSGALRIVAEGFTYRPGQKLVAPADCHNSVNGMRAFAQAAGAKVEYLNLPDDGKGLQPAAVECQLRRFAVSCPSTPGLFVITAQSNVTGLKAPLHALVPLASGLGYTTLVDAAAWLPTTPLSLKGLGNTIDALALSVYKMIGFPTGVGALIIKKSLLETLRKPWFSGGSVQLVQAPGNAVTMEPGSARFEDGTQNFLSMVPIPSGLALLKQALPHLGRRLPALLHWTVHELGNLRHQGVDSRRPLIIVRSPRPELGMGAKELGKLHGGLIAFEVVDRDGDFVNCEVIEYAASKQGISLRAGCMCNPGGAASIMGMQEMMAQLQSGETKKDVQARFGTRAAGVTRASFGIASNFEDAYRFVEFLRGFTIEGALAKSIHAFYSRDRLVSAC